jgi:plasmid stability protein
VAETQGKLLTTPFAFGEAVHLVGGARLARPWHAVGAVFSGRASPRPWRTLRRHIRPHVWDHDIMSREALPLYLTPEQHRALRELSARTGRSMSDLVRELLDRHLVGETPPTDIGDLVGSVELGHSTDIARDRDDMLAEAVRAVR